MKKILNILILVASLFLFSQGDGCSGGSSGMQEVERRRDQSLRDSIQLSLGATSPGSTTLTALEAAAISILSDFFDYMQIIRDTQKDSAFRILAVRMAHEQFISTKSIINHTSGHTYRIEEINTTPPLPEELHFPVPDSIWLITNLRKSSDTLYYGRLGFRLADSQEKQAKYTQIKTGDATFFALKKIKIFGTDSLSTWSVRLGDIVIP
ncbi:MAG: hypothetical protein U0T82_04835 [Bacteroidales bacterium]